MGLWYSCSMNQKEYKKLYRLKNAKKIYEYNKKYVREHPEHVKKYQSGYAKKHFGKISKYAKTWREANKATQQSYFQKYYQENKLKKARQNKLWKLENRERYNAYFVNKKKTDLNYKIACVLRNRIYNAVKHRLVKKAAKTEILIGTSVKNCILHLEGQFKKGMNWNNHSETGWHIDHIIPIYYFNLVDPEEQKKAFHYTNLQPLWAKTNLAKGKRIMI